MNSDAPGSTAMDSLGLAPVGLRADAPRMQYRSRPVSVAVDPISLVISECISITSAIQKHARSPHSSVSAILGGNPNPINLGTSTSLKVRNKSQSAKASGDSDEGMANRWGLRGQKGKSMQDNPMIAGFGKLRHEIAGIKGVLHHVPLLDLKSTPCHHF
jgi:brefeldin A-resistance guanine nucleotide exchange factor 1